MSWVPSDLLALVKESTGLLLDGVALLVGALWTAAAVTLRELGGSALTDTPGPALEMDMG
jgi:hypothetical protein